MGANFSYGTWVCRIHRNDRLGHTSVYTGSEQAIGLGRLGVVSTAQSANPVGSVPNRDISSYIGLARSGAPGVPPRSRTQKRWVAALPL